MPDEVVNCPSCPVERELASAFIPIADIGATLFPVRSSRSHRYRWRRR
ncbi:hypothetical protein [Mycolicibacterium moriokaense]|nr:hypothetical protein [Mycolicibacterium moriokaense]